MQEQRKAFKILIPSIILFVVVIIVAIWFGLDINGRIKEANYKPKELYGLEFKEWRYDTNGGSYKSKFYNQKHSLYPIYEYKNEEYKVEFFDFEIVNDSAYITNVKQFTSERDVYLPSTIKIDNKNYKVVGIKASAFETIMADIIKNGGIYYSINIYGNANITSLDDEFVSYAKLRLYNFSNLETVGYGNYIINDFIMNDKLLSIHTFNILSSLEKNDVYIGEKCKLIDLTEYEKNIFNDEIFINEFGNTSRLRITSIVVNENNPYYKMVNKSLYSKDMKKLYYVDLSSKDIHINDNELTIMPFALSGFSDERNVYFEGSITSIETYAINTLNINLYFNGDVNNVCDHIFANRLYNVNVTFNGSVNNIAANAFVNNGSNINVNK